MRALAVKYFEPFIGDAVIVGHGENEIGLVLFPMLESGRRLPGCEDAADLRELVAKPQFRAEIQRRLEELSRTGTSATTRITRAVLIPEAPSGAEITDKNTLSFSGVMNRRERDVVSLYDGARGDRFLYSEAAQVPLDAGAAAG